jgi:DNA-binding CsgD family transcriptional regulator
MGFIVPTDKESAVLVSLGRTSRLEAYTDEEQHRLMTLEPVVSSVVKLHQQLQGPLADTYLVNTTPMQKKMAHTLEFFGASLLTEKEKRVVNLMLRGHSSKSCARELGISPTTERVHRRNIYAKLNISSQAELFTRFFDALAA